MSAASELNDADDANSEKFSQQDNKKRKLSKSTIAMVERKRQNAILLRESRLQCKPTAAAAVKVHERTPQTYTYKTGMEKNPVLPSNSDLSDLLHSVNCRDCNVSCNASYLYEKFGENVCDECRGKDKDQFKLISKTDAKNEFVLKDCDLDSREPPLKYVTAPNPHNHRGSMRLFLQGQVYDRACEVHGGDEGIDAALLKRSQNRELFAQRKMNKKLADLRKLSKPRKIRETHVHEYGEEFYCEEDDEYSHTCKSCGYSETYEKL